MAERLLLVCDTCGKPAVETVTLRTSSGNRQRDYCTEHLSELLAGSRVPKRGRRPGSSNASSAAKAPRRKKVTGRTKPTTRTKATGRKKSTARRASPAKKR
jgi:hypothetical protein